MSISSLGGSGANSLLLQQLLSSLTSGAVDQTDGTDSAGSADSTGQASGLTRPPPPPPADGLPSDLFRSDTLGALTATQAGEPSDATASSLLDGVSSALASGTTAGVADTPSGAATTRASISASPSTTGATSSQQITSMLAGLMLQYANASYASQAASTTAATAAPSITA